MRRRIGEVVESSSHRFTAQCYTLYDAPPLGGLVRTESRNSVGENASGLYAVVSSVTTAPLEPGRTILARGEAEESEEDLYRSHPQLARLMSTRFEAVIVGHDSGSTVRHYLPDHPPHVHAFVFTASDEDATRFAVSVDFLPMLVNASGYGGGQTDEVVAACIRGLSVRLTDPEGFRIRAGKALANHLSGDLPRLDSLLKRLSP